MRIGYRKLSPLGFLILSTIVGASTDVATSEESLHRRASSECPQSSTFESKNGMNFTITCDTNNPGSDAYSPFVTSDMEDCMEHCSRFWGNGEGCYGVVWNQNTTQCWLKNSTTSAAAYYTEAGTHSALVPREELEPLDTDCPYDESSVLTLDSGESFTIRCNRVIQDFDYCPEEYPECNQSPFSGFWHTDTLADCIQICQKSHLLCQAVNWNPTMSSGFANCWPKTGFSSSLSSATDAIRHVATLSSFGDTVNTTCPEERYNANNKAFETHCGQSNAGTTFGTIHTANISSCLDSCASSSSECIGVNFDSTLASGFQNCYLQNSSSVISENVNMTYAVLAGTATPTTSTSATPSVSSTSTSFASASASSSPDSSSSPSKAWAAGPVIGGVAAIGMLLGAVLWYRRRKTATRSPPDELPTYEYAHEAPSYWEAAPVAEADASGEVLEIGGIGNEKRPRERTEPLELPS